MPAQAEASTAPRYFDEMVDGRGGIRPHWRLLVAGAGQLGDGGLAARKQRIDRALDEEGSAALLPGDPGRAVAGGAARTWQLDPLPLPIPPAEWSLIEAGLVERAMLLEALLDDLYGKQDLVREGLVPPAMVFANPEFLRGCRAPRVSRRLLSHLAVDLMRGPDGAWRVVADRSHAGDGIGMAREHRRILARTGIDLFTGQLVRQLRPFFDLWGDTLNRLAPREGGNPRIALLTPGRAHPFWFEHVLLARELGCVLAEATDLTAREGALYLKTLRGLVPVDVLLRRIEGRLCDPLEFGGPSDQGVPGLMDAMRAGAVRIANDPGTGLIEAPALACVLPGLARRVLGRELLLGAPMTLWLGDPSERAAVEAEPRRYRLRSAFDANARALAPFEASPGRRLPAQVAAAPWAWVATEPMQASAAPFLDERSGGFVPLPLLLRTWLVRSAEGWHVMPGGLARALPEGDPLVARMPATGIAKDVWVIAESRTDIVGPQPRDSGPLQITRAPAEITSRTADNLYWLGRYVERAENTSRLLRAALARIARGALLPRDLAEVSAIARCLATAGFLDPEAARASPESRALPASLAASCHGEQPFPLLWGEIARLASAVRDRLTPDMWAGLSHSLGEVRRGFQTAGHDPDRLIEATGTAVRFSTWLAGIAAENMVRGGARLFLDLGRRIERAGAVARDVAVVLDLPPGRSDAGLRLALELADSQITYRSRYLAAVQGPAVLDLVLADPGNPRSLVFQIEGLAGLLAELAGPADALTAEATQLVAEAQRTARLALAEARTGLGGIEARVARLSDAIGRRYFSHVRPATAFGVGEEQQAPGTALRAQAR